nr:hypothetical protein [Tanacetum cinerariifolium]
MYHDLYLGGKALVERENVVLDLTMFELCPSFIKDLIAKGVGLRVVDSHTEGKTVILLPFTMNGKYSIHVQTCELTKEELADFLELYPIPFELNPFGYTKLTTFFVICKAYGCKPSVELFKGFFNLFPDGKWLTFSKRSEKHIPYLFPKVITHMEGWKGRFFFVQNSIVPVNYPELLSKDNRWEAKSFRDKLPDKIYKSSYFQRLGRYPTSVRVFSDPILFMVEMAFINFMYSETDEDVTFLPKETSPEFGTSSPSMSINTKLHVVAAKQLVENTSYFGDSPHHEQLVIHSESVAARIKDRKCRMIGGSSKLPYLLIVYSYITGLPNVLELQDANSCHLKISAITPPAWKGHLDNQLDVQLLDLHDKQMKGECDMLKETEKERDKECEELKAKCEADMTDFENNPAMIVLREKVTVLQGEVKEHKASLERMLLEIQKWAGYQVSLSTLESKVASLEAEKVKLEATRASLRKFVVKLASASVFYGRCPALEEVAKMKEPFDLSKVKGYRSTYNKEYIKAGNDLANSTFPFLSEIVADPSAPIKVLLLKKPQSLQRHAPLRTLMPAPSAPSL